MSERERSMEPLLQVEGLAKHFEVRSGPFSRRTRLLRAVDGVSFRLARGETLALVGESGSGKTTVGRTLLRLHEPTAGRALYFRPRVASEAPLDLFRLPRRALRGLRRELQMIFQDPYSSLNPRMSAGTIVGEALRVHGLARGSELEQRVAALFARVGLRPEDAARYPHEFSGGQRQRIAIARALALEPNLVVCDEPVSALDVSIRAQIAGLLDELRRELGLAYLLIAHDLAFVRHLADRVAVLYLGRVVETAPVEALFERPAHPYTQALLAAAPRADPRHRKERTELHGDPPSPLSPPDGCAFHTRCPVAIARCRVEEPARVRVAEGHEATCHLLEGETVADR